jgi:hypothetical protein
MGPIDWYFVVLGVSLWWAWCKPRRFFAPLLVICFAASFLGTSPLPLLLWAIVCLFQAVLSICVSSRRKLAAWREREAARGRAIERKIALQRLDEPDYRGA